VTAFSANSIRSRQDLTTLRRTIQGISKNLSPVLHYKKKQ